MMAPWFGRMVSFFSSLGLGASRSFINFILLIKNLQSAFCSIILKKEGGKRFPISLLEARRKIPLIPVYERMSISGSLFYPDGSVINTRLTKKSSFSEIFIFCYRIERTSGSLSWRLWQWLKQEMCEWWMTRKNSLNICQQFFFYVVWAWNLIFYFKWRRDFEQEIFFYLNLC